MTRLIRRSFGTACSLLAAVAVLAVPGALATHGGDTEVTVASNDAVFSQNKQNEPALAVDVGRIARGQPANVLAAGSNDNIDMEACNVGDDTTCPFTNGVGVSGIYFSFDSGDTWTQPQYSGYSARTCLGVAGTSTDTCSPLTPQQDGMIGTLPWYYESGLVSDGDPALAFGPVPKNGTFDWANGSRLYYANLTSNFGAQRSEQSFKGFEAIAVSRTDNVAAAAAGSKNAWLPPVIASAQKSSTIFADKEQIWADNASSSDFFGNVYICFAEFRSQPGAAAPLVVLTSRDGGATWTQKQVTPAHNVAPTKAGQSGCTIRTDSNGVVYAFYEQFQSPFRFLPPQGTHMLVKSYDGGRSWTRPMTLFQIIDPCYFVDPVIQRCVEDGVAGARNDLSGSPSVDIANGAPDGTGATNEIVDVWADGTTTAGPNNEKVLLRYSTTGGTSWSGPQTVSSPSDRGYYAAPGISPNGRDLYVVYNAFTTPFRNSAVGPGNDRELVGVVKHADIVGGTPAGWTELHRGVEGDARGSSQNNLQAEFLGDYVYAIATNTYGAGVWNDARNAADCPAMDAWRQSLRDGTSVPTPAPQQDCPATFGNTDIFGGSYADPTP